MSITKTFSAVGTTAEMRIKKGETLLYRFDALASWDGTVILRKSTDGGMSYTTIATYTTADNNGLTLVATEDANYSFQCTVFTAGTAAVTLTNLAGDVVASDSAGRAAIGTAAVEERSGVVHKTIIRLASVPVSVVSVTTGAGVGGTKIYDFPEGAINMLGCVADLSCVIAAADQAAFTDATPAGDIGIGTVAPANADALGTDATDDDFATAVALTMADYSSNSQLASEPAVIMDGTTTAKDMYVNLLIDAADIDDDTTTTVYVSGVVTCTWMTLGDY